jgi:zinc protease
VLQSRLLDTIRQELGGTYSITASQSVEKIPRPEYTVRIDWTCDPTRTADLVQRVLQEIEFVKTTPLTPGQMSLVRAALQREFETNSQDNGYLLNQIAERYADGDSADVAAIWNLPDRLGTLTAGAIQDAAQSDLTTNHYVIVTLVPQKK